MNTSPRVYEFKDTVGNLPTSKQEAKSYSRYMQLPSELMFLSAVIRGHTWP